MEDEMDVEEPSPEDQNLANNNEEPWDSKQKLFDIIPITPYPNASLVATTQVHNWLRTVFHEAQEIIHQFSWMPIFALTASHGFDTDGLVTWGKILVMYGLVAEKVCDPHLIIGPMRVIGKMGVELSNLSSKQVAAYTALQDAMNLLDDQAVMDKFVQDL